jgi:hypothetical protein
MLLWPLHAHTSAEFLRPFSLLPTPVKRNSKINRKMPGGNSYLSAILTATASFKSAHACQVVDITGGK